MSQVRIIRSVQEMEEARSSMEAPFGLVPTMGYLHEGHLSLVRRSVADNGTTIVSIFVNPTQFGPGEDLERYPRDEERDLELLGEAGTDIVFIPAAEEMYPAGFDDWVEVQGPLTERLEGAHRPGHFRGVATVVARLFRIVRPDIAYFGQKDAQQLAVIRRMTRDLELPVQVVGMPIVREDDGLAMSSRNVYLSPEERGVALVLSRALGEGQRMADGGEKRAGKIRLRVESVIAAEPAVDLDYVSVSDAESFVEMDAIDRPALLLIAARVGSTRLIDNASLGP